MVAILVLRRLLKMRATTKRLFVLLILFYQEVVHAQEAATVNRPVINPLAVGGMVQGLLDMQIRPQGGFYEERYKEIFPDDNVVLATASHVDRRQTPSHASLVSEDGRLLSAATRGTAPNPCFDPERIRRNRLLMLLCALQLSRSPST